MTSFVHIDYPTVHPGVARAERAAASLKQLGRRAGAGGTLLLAAVVSALLVVANQVVDTWTEGHLLAAWIVVLWTIAFAAIGLLAAPARRLAQRSRSSLRGWRVARRQAEADRRMWEVALTDARVMADISRAMSAGATRDVRAYY